MKILAKITVILLLVYLLLWGGIALYFNFAEQQKGLLEANLSSLFQRDVSIEEVRTSWRGAAPVIQIDGFRVAGDLETIPALAFDSMTAELEPLSILRLWPSLTEFAVERPQLEVVSLPSKQLQVAGIKLGSSRSEGFNARRLFAWLINHQSAVWLDGEVVWRRPTVEPKRYTDISFIYQRESEVRQLSATAQTPKGAFAFSATANGNMLNDKDWDASLEILGDRGQRLLSPDDLSMEVVDGNGTVQLRQLDVQRVRDFLLLAGLGDTVGWILDADLSGRLQDVSFDFSGPFLAFDDWSLTAGASDVAFKPTPNTPGMSNLTGSVEASARGGTFEFAAQQTRFEWQKWFDESFEIGAARGRFRWEFKSDGQLDIALEDGFFEDDVARIWDLNANGTVSGGRRDVSNLADLFKVESVADLSFEEGKVVDSTSSGPPLFLQVGTRFSVKSMPELRRFLPNDPRLAKFQKWWENGFLSGQVEQGRLSYSGEVSKTALREGKAQLNGSATFSGVDIDYGYERDWPILFDARGHATLQNELLTITPDEARIEEDQLRDSQLTIEPLFQRSRELQLRGSMDTSLMTVMEFLFDGPLLKPEQRGKPLPIVAEGGSVSADVSVTIPLQRVRNARVIGVAQVKDGVFRLPQGVPVTAVNALMNFTERTASSEQITAQFLGGETTAKLVTTRPAQPPKMRVSASGVGNLEDLEPWMGEHLLSWMQGRTAWQGSVEIDGPQVDIVANSDLAGVTVTAPEPLAKAADQARPLSFSMRVGGADVQQQIDVSYGNYLRTRFRGDMSRDNELFDSGLIQMGADLSIDQAAIPAGVNFHIEHERLDLDAWLDAVIDLAQLETKPVPEPNTDFLDAMRSVRIATADPIFLGRNFGPMQLSTLSADGAVWIGTVSGEHVNGTLQAEPRAFPSLYRFKLDNLDLVESIDDVSPPEPIDTSLKPSEYPRIELSAGVFRVAGRNLGSLALRGAPNGNVWQLQDMSLTDAGIKTAASGDWVNNSEEGSRTLFDVETVIDEAGDVLNEMEFDNLIKKGNGSLTSTLTWIGAPHEFDFGRLNGDFDLQISDGELMQVESGAGKLIGLLNFNSIARRLTLDFRDVFSSGLTFDRMQYAGVLSNGEALMREAYMLSPAAFVRMEGKIDLDKELIDMEIHASPDLAGNLTLLSALASPTAGALVFLTQQIFKEQMRSSNLQSYRALGTWEDFELVEFDANDPDSDPDALQPAQLQQEEPQQEELQPEELQPQEPQPQDAGQVDSNGPASQ